MEHNRSDGTQSSAKRLKLDEEEKDNNQDQIAVANAANGAEEENIADANDGSSPNIFKLDIDCCEEVFAYLPLRDLHSLGQTCKKMHQFTGYFVRENYRSTEFHWCDGNLWHDSEMNGFIEFISNLQIISDQLERFAEFAPRFKSIRKLRLDLKYDQIDCIKEILYKCEEIDIRFDRSVLNIDLYEKILKFCTILKHFSLNPTYNIYTVLENNNWLIHEYPNLEYLDLYSNSSAQPPIDEIRRFFTLNKGIQKFRTNFRCFWNCRHWILDTDIKLDELLVDCACFDLFINSLNREHINLLNTLYERGFYKHLSLLEIDFNDNSILAEIRAPLTMEIYKFGSPLPPLDLKKLKILRSSISTANLETFLINNFSTIERVYFRDLKAESVLFFVRSFMKLREIKVDFLDEVNSFNLQILNEERKKLVGAVCVTIYLNKSDFNQVINRFNLELVKIKLLK